MGLFSDSVPREIYDRLHDDYRDLLEKYHALRPTHDPASKIRMIPPKPDSGQEAVMAIDRAFVDPRVGKAFEELTREGMAPGDALREANRLIAVATGKSDASSATSPRDLNISTL